MINGGETADKMVEYSLRFGEIAVRLSGSAAKNLAAYLTALSKDSKKTKGKTRLIRMLKEGKELKVFQISTTDAQKFAQMAKKYGVLFTVLRDRKNPDGTLDLMVKLEDASKVARVLEKLKMSSLQTADIRASDTRGHAPENPTKGRMSDYPSEASWNGRTTTGKTTDRPSVRASLEKLQNIIRPKERKPGRNTIQVPPLPSNIRKER